MVSGTIPSFLEPAQLRPLFFDDSLGALEEAVATRLVKPGLIHHSDRGVQYASYAYTERLLSMDVQISMSAKGNAYENAKAESFFKTLKQEEVYLKAYQTFEEASS